MTPVILETGVETTVSAIRAEHPGLMFGQGSDLSHIGIGWLVETQKPEGNYRRGPNILVQGRWQTSWEEYVPEKEKVMSVTPRQAKRVLLQRNLLSMVENAIESLEEPQRSLAKIDWNSAQEIRRDNETFIMLVTALGFTEKQIDMLFEEASKIV